MLTQNKDKKREQIQMFCMDELVPKDHLLRQIDNAIDWSFIYDLVKDKYCNNKALDDEVNAVKSSEKWRREYMTLQMRDNENKQLGEITKLVHLVGRLDDSNIEVASGFLDCSVEEIHVIRSLMKLHPEKDDEEIAELYIYQQD